MYGKDRVHNAIDVSTDVTKAKKDIHLVFGDFEKEEHGEAEKTDEHLPRASFVFLF